MIKTSQRSIGGQDAKGEDGIPAFSNGDRLVVQVVSVPVDSTYRKNVSKGNATARLSFKNAASWIAEAIQKKLVIASVDGANIVLALDVRHCAQLAHGQVIAALKSDFNDPAKHGFAQIWLVGPVPDRCRKVA
jgi:hypothetical protein